LNIIQYFSDLTQRYLDKSLDPNGVIRKQDGTKVISSIANNRIGRDMTWDWLRSNWDQISSYFDTAISSSVGKIVSSIASDFNTELKLKELEEFYETNKDHLRTARKDTKIAINWVKVNIAWMENNFKVIVTWLSQQTSRFDIGVKN
jgi:aminopeptidase N